MTRKITVCARVDADLVERLDSVKNRFSRSAMLNEVLDLGLNEIEKKYKMA